MNSPGIIVVCLLLGVQIASAQRLFFNAGAGSYAMEDLKATQTFVAGSTPRPLESVSSFPSYWSFEGGVTFDLFDLLDNVTGGIAVGYGSTGARAAYTDYSGSLRFDQLANYTCIALLPSYQQYYFNNQMRVDYEIRVGTTLNKMAFSYHETIGSTTSSEQIDLRSTNMYLQPGISAGWRFRSFSLDAYLGYHLSVLQGKVRDKNDNDLVLYNPTNNKPAGVDWSGARVGVGLSFYLHLLSPAASRNPRQAGS
jgi:hypothetical protein